MSGCDRERSGVWLLALRPQDSGFGARARRVGGAGRRRVRRGDPRDRERNAAPTPAPGYSTGGDGDSGGHAPCWPMCFLRFLCSFQAAVQVDGPFATAQTPTARACLRTASVPRLDPRSGLRVTLRVGCEASDAGLFVAPRRPGAQPHRRESRHRSSLGFSTQPQPAAPIWPYTGAFEPSFLQSTHVHPKRLLSHARLTGNTFFFSLVG